MKQTPLPRPLYPKVLNHKKTRPTSPDTFSLQSKPAFYHHPASHQPKTSPCLNRTKSPQREEPHRLSQISSRYSSNNPKPSARCPRVGLNQRPEDTKRRISGLAFDTRRKENSLMETIYEAVNKTVVESKMKTPNVRQVKGSPLKKFIGLLSPKGTVNGLNESARLGMTMTSEVEGRFTFSQQDETSKSFFTTQKEHDRSLHCNKFTFHENYLEPGSLKKDDEKTSILWFSVNKEEAEGYVGSFCEKDLGVAQENAGVDMKVSKEKSFLTRVRSL